MISGALKLQSCPDKDWKVWNKASGAAQRIWKSIVRVWEKL